MMLWAACDMRKRDSLASGGSPDEEITTKKAAKLLRMSHPSLLKLLDAGKLPSLRVRNQRRLNLKDVIAYARTRDSERKAALDRLARIAAKAGLYDRNTFPEGGRDE